MKCAKCNQPTVGKSRYCYEHRKESRQNFKTMVAEQAAERAERYGKFEALYKQAHQAGLEAAKRCTPAPMVVAGHANPLDDTSPIKEAWYVSEGVCGFAWVKVAPANTSFAKWAVKQGLASSSYGGGISFGAHGGGQSYERNHAYAQAFAEVLKQGLAEIDPHVKYVYADGRLD